MRNRQNLLRNKSLTFWGHLTKRVIFALVAILCILIIIAVAFYVFSWKKQSDTDKQVNMDAAEFIIPDMADQSNDEKTEETVTQTGTEDTVNVKSTKKQTDSKNSSTNQSKKKNTTEQSETGTSYYLKVATLSSSVLFLHHSEFLYQIWYLFQNSSYV